MKLTSFEIKSYRSCQNTKFSLIHNLTGLIGINGSGKSNILNALLLLKKISESRNRYGIDRDPETFFNRCKIKASLEHKGVTIKIDGVIKLRTDTRNNDEIIYSDIKWNFSNFKNQDFFTIPVESVSLGARSLDLRYSSRFRPVISKDISISKSYLDLWRLFSDKDFKKNVAPILRDLLIFLSEISYYSATQFSDPAKCPTSIELEDDRLRRRFHTSSQHERFFYDLYNSKIDNPAEYERYINTVGREGVGLISNFEFKRLSIPSNSYKVQSGGINKISDVRFLIVPIFTIAKKKLSPNQLSEGTLKTLALIYYIISDKSRFLLIEEPEVCVHHGLLDGILSLIIGESRKKQIIISTHSDYVLDRLKPENILLVEHLETRGTVARQLKETMSKCNYSALKKYLKEAGSLGEYWREGGFSHK